MKLKNTGKKCKLHSLVLYSQFHIDHALALTLFHRFGLSPCCAVRRSCFCFPAVAAKRWCCLFV